MATLPPSCPSSINSPNYRQKTMGKKVFVKSLIPVVLLEKICSYSPFDCTKEGAYNVIPLCPFIFLICFIILLSSTVSSVALVFSNDLIIFFSTFDIELFDHIPEISVR